ncbi:hypothetical protein [Roseovarius mucosus]|uniref:hypothetical protein n=1 Tax=Roseovarius mucosus TaxID=215743 RepID=UPI0035D0D9BB
MTVADIIKTIRRDHGGAWWALFHGAEKGGFRFLPTGQIVSAAEHAAVVSAFAPVAAPQSAPERAPLTAADRKRNTLRARAVESHEGGRRYGRN